MFNFSTTIYSLVFKNAPLGNVKSIITSKMFYHKTSFHRKSTGSPFRLQIIGAHQLMLEFLLSSHFSKSLMPSPTPPLL